ncbi:MAG: sigma-54 dependent transcriptional regulator [Flavobacteriales bacterium]|nr:sigma-54 dependent transcriptional regulator [Flavobacteriales bacterium]
MEEFKIYIVEDDKWYSELLRHHLELNPDYHVKVFEDGTSFLKALPESPNVVCLDYSIPDINGAKLMKRIQEISPSTSVIIISGQEDIQVAISLLKQGAYDYLIKDENTKDRLWRSIINIRESDQLKKEVTQLKKEVGKLYEEDKSFIGESDGIKDVKALIQKAAKAEITVSITGETGTGKEVVAKSIHYTSQIKGPFVAVNVSAIPKDLLESELFGHEKGAFTGANSRRIGKFEEANGGTLFLDEIGEMDPNMQAKLLRALQEREIVRLGGNKSISIKTRVITATHRNLLEEVSKGTFRQDLYYRLIGLPIEIPPLRERKNDIKLLAQSFAINFSEQNGMGNISLTPAALTKLKTYSFPGNVRELKAIVDLAAVMCDDNTIDESDITFHSNGLEMDSLLESNLSLRGYTAKIVQHFLDKNNGNVLKVAKRLNVGKSTIYRMIQSNDVKI